MISKTFLFYLFVSGLYSYTTACMISLKHKSWCDNSAEKLSVVLCHLEEKNQTLPGLIVIMVEIRRVGDVSGIVWSEEK